MSYEKGIGRIFNGLKEQVIASKEARTSFHKKNSPINRIADGSKYLKPDTFTGRGVGKAIAGQVYAHHLTPASDRKLHSANSARGQRTLGNLWKKSDERLLGLTISGPDSEEPAVLPFKVDSDEGHNSLVNLFQKSDGRRAA